MINGIINIYKEKGYTSHDVVAKMRGILHQKKIGHTGTLDPDAVGVLPVCLGGGTRLCDMITDKDKVYRAVMLLGCETDTQDTSGTILHTKEVTNTEEEIRQVILSFVGEYDQIPPMYSALKVNGKKLYELAREGKTVERAARRVQITKIEIEEIRLPRVTMTVHCSKGTYIRTLCHDIGQKLFCGGCMEQLTRIRVGRFLLEDSISLAELKDLSIQEDPSLLQSRIIRVEEMFLEYPGCQVSLAGEKMLLNGNPISEELVTGELPLLDTQVRMCDSQGAFCAIYEYKKSKHRFQPVKMFLDCRTD